MTAPGTSRRTRLEPGHVPGKGWTVVRVTGGRRTGRTLERTDAPDTYTLAQAQACADAMRRYPADQPGYAECDW